jgi:ABC-2 type transport system ATP-binding protein
LRRKAVSVQSVAPAVRVDNVWKRYRIYHERNLSLKSAMLRGRRAEFEEFWALREVSFDIPRGATFGLIGDNGSGKSTMLKCIAKILTPTQGRVTVDGTLAALLELGSGFHPELSGRENIYLNGSILGLRRSDIEARYDEIVDFAGVRSFIDQPVKNYSSGMYVRLGFSIAINVNPEILLVDEVLAVGDANFQDKCMEKFADFRRAGKTVVLVSHSMGSMRALCDEVAWLEHGRVLAAGAAPEIVSDYIDSSHQVTTTLQGGVHNGSGEATIDSVELVTKDGERATELAYGDPLNVRVRYRTDQPIENAVVGLAVETVDGRVLWGSNTREADLPIKRLEGTGTVEFTVPSTPFQGQRLSLVASITDYSTTHVYDFLRGDFFFTVDEVRPPESGGPIALGGRWTHKPDSAVSATKPARTAPTAPVRKIAKATKAVPGTKVTKTT